MLHYQFPIIRHIDDLKEVLDKEGTPFGIICKDDYNVVNYMYQDNETFSTPLEAECRGLIFGKDGGLLSRRFHKFFNAGERESLTLDKIDLSKPHVILEKLDGSMVSPIPMPNGGFRLATKAGITDVSMQAETWMEGKETYKQFIEHCIGSGMTPIFEWCSPTQRIVLDYKEPTLILLACRFNVTGMYVKYSSLKTWSVAYSIPLVQAFKPSSDINELIAQVRSKTDAEGVVVRFEDGHMVKIKSDWYVKLHKAKDDIRNESKVLKIILDDKLDDLLPVLMEDDKESILEYRENFYKNILLTSDAYLALFQRACAFSGRNRKEFANYVLTHFQRPSIFFKIFDGTTPDMAILDFINKHFKKPDEMRDLIPFKYKEIKDTDE